MKCQVGDLVVIMQRGDLRKLSGNDLRYVGTFFTCGECYTDNDGILCWAIQNPTQSMSPYAGVADDLLHPIAKKWALNKLRVLDKVAV